MISFEILTAESAEELVLGGVKNYGFSEDELSEIVSSFLELLSEEDIEIGLAVSHGCVLARIFDMGRYMFVYPIEMGEGSDAASAIDEIRAYAAFEELPLVITDIPAECLGELAAGFNHTVIDREAGGESFRLEARSECALLSGKCPEITFGDITLRMPTDEDIPYMARLNKDRELNKYWGYDYLSDVGEVEDSYFIENARHEAEAGVALALSAVCGGKYVGEAVLYAFDYSGGAELAVRILPEHQGRGLGSLCVEAIARLCESIGIDRIIGRADERNIPSRKMVEKTFDMISHEGGIVYYVRKV